MSFMGSILENKRHPLLPQDVGIGKAANGVPSRHPLPLATFVGLLTPLFSFTVPGRRLRKLRLRAHGQLLLSAEEEVRHG
ncbi:hypothetical protein KL86PLE_60167 [uncultured Pleomorphomonas sp.]|uniref:Uncharacterized protein n=1 Tax=uncultured Pleomorphomonas sp. TaxID=442121 RepID=A0A212LJX1_9HYPH|nr:hypothetical protein KL86PLE_60167 [uncultured Pleomorphomonas sp.]